MSDGDKYDYFLMFDKECLFGVEIREDIYLQLKKEFPDNKLPNNHSLKVKRREPE